MTVAETVRAAVRSVSPTPVRAIEPTAGGRQNTTVRVTLGDDRVLAVQLLRRRVGVEHRVRLASQLPPRFATVGVRLPRVLGAAPGADPAWIVREWLPGLSAAALLDGPAGEHVATQLGAACRLVSTIDAREVRLYRLWSRPNGLASAARRWLERVPVVASTRAHLEADIGALTGWLPGRVAGFAHGDLHPGNAVVTPDGALVGLLDVEFARLADPLFDAAWWYTLVRSSSPVWHARWSAFAAAAHLVVDDEPWIRRLGRVRLLEAAADRGADRRTWANQLSRACQWDEGN